MPRIPRNNMKASFFHIMVQGIKKEYIFNKKEDIEKYIDLLENYEYSTFKRKYNGDKKEVLNVLNNFAKGGYTLNKRECLDSKDAIDEEIFVFLEDGQTKENVCEEILSELISRYKGNVKNWKDDKEFLIKIIRILKMDYKMPYKVISNQIGMSRETLRKLLMEDV